jgi:6,7-dimethyl-8-ribityllumazine synthase
MTEFRGEARGDGLRVCIVVSRFNVMVTERLLEGAIATLRERGVAEADIDVVSVPGAWELGIAARAAADRGYDAIVGLGAVIRGETPHFEYVCEAATQGLLRVQAETRTPVGLGVLTTEDLPQALARSGGDVGHAGAQAADAALEVADLLRRLG